MPDISRITLPSGTTYNIKDAEARSAISELNSFEYLVSTDAASTPYGVSWQNGGTTITGTLVASSNTKYKIYLVPSTNGTNDVFDEYITVNPSSDNYIWEKFGSTSADFADLGELAYKDSASGSYTPEGTVSQPTFTGSELTSAGKFTPAGTVGTPTISVELSSTSKYVASSSTGGGTVSAGSAASCTLPTFSTSVSDETLVLSWSAGSFAANVPTSVTLPTFAEQTIATGVSSATSSQPSFTGTEGDLSVKGTPSGTVSQPTFSGTAKNVTVS